MKKIACFLSGNIFGDVGMITLLSYYIYVQKKLLIIDTTNNSTFKQVFAQVRKKFVDKTIVYRSSNIESNIITDIPEIDTTTGKAISSAEPTEEDKTIIEECKTYVNNMKDKYETNVDMKVADSIMENISVQNYDTILVIYNTQNSDNIDSIDVTVEYDQCVLLCTESNINKTIESASFIQVVDKQYSAIFYQENHEESANLLKEKFNNIIVSSTPFAEISHGDQEKAMSAMKSNLDGIIKLELKL
ncbi:hypothetical protein AB837_00324 [bacterium AB1]|nr:hypothetical protein AB837_00324 [bacterium AB1]